MADGYGPITSEPVLTLEELIRRNRQIAARKAEIKTREETLIREAQQRDASTGEDPGSVEGRQSRKEQLRKEPIYHPPLTRPKTALVNGEEVPIDDAIAKIPSQIDFEQYVQQSPLKDKALRRRRTEDLVSEGKSQEEAEQIALSEQQARKAQFDKGRESARSETLNRDKEARAFADSSAAGIIAPVARMLGYGQAADEVEARNAGVQAEMSRHRQENYSHPEIAGAVAGAAQNVAQMAPGIAASMVAGPGAGMAVMAGQFGSQEYSRAAYEGAEAGLSGSQLKRYALVQGGIEASIMPIMNKLPGLGGIESRVIRQSIARRIASNPSVRKVIAGGKSLAKDTAAELAEEIITETLHGVATEKLLSQDVDYKAVLKDTVLQTLLMMGMTEGAHQAGRLATSGEQRTPVFPDQNPAEDPNSFTQTPIDEMISARDAAAGSQPPVPPEIDAFTNNPSRTKYNAAVKAGMPPLETSNETTRKKYADDWMKDPLGMRKKMVPSTPTPGNATLEPSPESPPAMVAGDEQQQPLMEEQNGQESDVQGIQGIQGQRKDGNQSDGTQGKQGEEGRQELLKPPAGTQDTAPPAESQEVATPAAHTNREEFETVYSDRSKKLKALADNDPKRRQYIMELADLFDANPEWAKEIENQKTPPSDAGAASPDQSLSLSTDPGSFSEPDVPEHTSYHSGLSRSPAEVDEAIKTGTPVGVSAYANISAPMRKKLVDYANADGKVFVDSGAFTAFRKGKEIDWDKTLFAYHELLSSVKPEKRSNFTIVAPDIVGDHVQTMELQSELFEKFTPIIELGGQVIVPVQKENGKGSIWKHWADATNSFTPEQNDNFIVGIPFNEAAWSQDDVLRFMRSRDRDAKQLGGSPTPFHLLGGGPSKLNKLFEAAAAEGLSTEGISGDALPAKISKRKKPPKQPTVKSERSLRKIVLGEGGVSAKSLRKDYNQKQLKEDGLLGVMRITGQPLDELAQMLETSGHLKTPEGRTPADWLLQQLKDNADSAKTEYTDAEIEAQLEKEREAYDKLKEYESEKDGIDELRKRSEEEGILAANAEEPNEGPITEAELEVIDTSFDFGANKPAAESQSDEDAFSLKRPEKPKPKAEDFGTNPNSKQGGLFDAGKKGDKKGQELLFNSDPGDLNNPKTQENKSKSEQPDNVGLVEPSQEDLMEAILREELGEAEAKPAKERKPRKQKLGERVTNPDGSYFNKPPEPKAPKTPRSDAAKKRTERTAAELKAAEDNIFKAFNATPNTGLNPEQMRATAQLVKAALNHNVSTFNEFVAYVVDRFKEPMALRMAEGIELAWRALKRLPDYSGIDDAGKVVDVIDQRKAMKNGDTTSTPDKSVGTMPGESGGTLEAPTGSTTENGDAEDGTGSDVESLPEGTDGTGGTESDAIGGDVEGNGIGTDAGTKPKPGRKPSVRGSRKPTGSVQGKVESTNNLRISPDDTIAPKGVVGKLNANIAAIKLLRQLASEDRAATDAEKKTLMQYTGWGSLQHVFDENRGDAFVKQPGLTRDQYRKSMLYQKENEYSPFEKLQERAEAWEKQWGDSYKFLKETLSPDEWKKAAASVLNAHFTSRDVITHGIWGALEQMGVTGGRFMEPSSGIGSFIGLMPDAIANGSEVIAIELDSLTGEMVKRLYPDADVHVKGFEEVPIPAGTIDVAATNVPFHKIGPADAKKRYGREMNLHNYFIARMLDSLRPGGIAAVISTHFSMDANPEDRALMASKADLVGAIRLPNSAFKANAGTEVTTDIMFFRKPDGTPFKGEAWQNLASVGTYTAQLKNKKGVLTGTETLPITVNEYFANHPEMVLGTHSMEGKQYSDTEYTVLPVKGESIADQLQKAVANLPAGIADANNAPMMPSIESGTVGVDGRIEFRGGKLQELSDGKWTAPQWILKHIDFRKDGKTPRAGVKPETRAAKVANAMTRAIAYTNVRNALEVHVANMRSDDASEAEYLASQKALNTAYDAYRKSHGPLNDTESYFLEGDPGFFSVSGLEVEAEREVAGKKIATYAKADIFRERTLNADSAPTTADTTEEAVKMSLAWKGSINLPWMSDLTGRTEDDLRTELLDSGIVFQDPETSLLEPADTYLAGNVQAKLRHAEQAVADGDKRFERNVELLKAVQPAKVTIDAITPSISANWVPTKVINRWLNEVVGLKYAEVKFNEKADIWSVTTGNVPRDIQNKWATNSITFGELLPKVLNGSTISIRKADPSDPTGKKTIVDEAQTQAAQIKAEKMRDAFESWAKSDEKAIPVIEEAFNEQKNFYVKPKFNGEHLTFPGMSAQWLKWMRPYQKNTIWRAIREGRGMIAHGVGAGKTLEMIAIAMEMKRLGTANKPLLVVQNSTLGQFARTFTEVYPAAKVLVAGKQDLNPENRAKFMARITTGNWDAVVMAKSTFNMKLPSDPALERAMVEGLIDELKSIMLENELADGKGAPSVKAIQQQINSLIKRLDKIIERVNAHTDKDVYFEQMGIDALFLDEAHDYKKPPFVTKLDKSIKGISNEVSGRALAALIKMRFVQGNNRGRNTFMATGTPITNTLGESWLLMNMVAPDVLQEFGVNTFDQFVSTFAEVKSSLEQNPVGKLVRRTRLAKFKNGHQLAQFIQSGWDVLLGDELHDKIREYGGGKLPTMEGGKEMLQLVDRSPEFNKFADFLLRAFDQYKSLTGEDKRTYSWIPVVIYGAAKAAAIDVRLVDPTAKDDPGSKINKMVEGVFRSYEEGTNVTLQDGDKTLTGQNLTQLIFSDISGQTSIDKLQAFAGGEDVTVDIEEDDGSDDDETNDTDSEEENVPAKKNKKQDRWLYNEIKRKLIEKGIPEDQVQIINDHNSTTEKLLAFQDKVSAGQIRIVIGHSDTLGTGVNVQQRLKDIWELDIPMVPAKRQQRIGRGIRSGNMNATIRVHVMAMQKSLDGTLMEMNLRKAKAAEQALSGKAGAEFDDPYSESLMSMADMEAAMNDDPLFYRKRDLEFQLRAMLLDKEALDQQRSSERGRLRSNEYSIERSEEAIVNRAKLADKLEAVLKADNSFKVEGKTAKTAAEAEKALKAEYKAATEVISAKTQDSKIKTLDRYSSPEASHFAADAEYGPIQFNLFYGERPEVVQDEKGNPSTKWVSTSGTIITMDGKALTETRATTLSTLMDAVKEMVPDLRQKNAASVASIAENKAENKKLKDFLDSPYEGQIELDNLQSELEQINQLMFERDNPDAVKAKPPTVPVTQEQMPNGYFLVAPGEIADMPAMAGMEQKANDKWFIYAPGGFTVTPGGADTAQLAYHKAQQDTEHGTNFPNLDSPVTDPSSPDTVAEEPEVSYAQKAANEAQAAIDAQKVLNSNQDKIIKRSLQNRSTGGMGIPISDELARAVITRVFGEIKLNVKRFDLLIKNLRVGLEESEIRELKSIIIEIWNTLREKKGLIGVATEAEFEAALANNVDTEVEQALEAVKALTETTPAESQKSEPAIAGTPPRTPENSPELPGTQPELPGTPENSPEQSMNPTMSGDEKTFSPKNEFTDSERERLGMPKRVPLGPHRRQIDIDLARAEINSVEGNARIDATINDLMVTGRAPSAYETALLNARFAQLDNKYEAALRAKVDAASKGDDVQAALHSNLAEKHLNEQMALLTLESTTASHGLGAGLQARKDLINRNYTMARSVLEFEAAFKRKPDKPGEMEAIQKMVDDLNASNERLRKLLDEASEDIESLEARLKEAHDGKVRKPRESKPIDTKKPATEKKDSPRQAAARAKIDSARKKFRELLTLERTNSFGGALYTVADASLEMATGYAELGVISLADFLKKVNNFVGPEAKKYTAELTEAWKQVRSAMGETDLSQITDQIDPMDPDTVGRAARSLHSFVIERDGLDGSPEGREAAVVAVHDILTQFVPELTPEETARAMSGIGIYSELSDNEIEAIRRDQKAQLLLLEQIGDWKKGQAPPATGQERGEISDEQRALRRAVNEAKKASGVETKTEGQLRSALDAAKRMVQNRIADLTKAIDENNPIKRSKTVLEDPSGELGRLQAIRDDLQKQYDKAFGKNELSEEQRLNAAEKALDRAIANLEADLKEGKLYPDDPMPRLTSPAIEAKQATLDALKASREELRISTGKAEARSDAAYERKLKERNAELARRLAEGDFKPKPKKPERKLTPELLKEMRINEKLKIEMLKKRKEWLFSQQHVVYRAFKKGVVGPIELWRKMMTAFDASLIGRQGRLLGGANPKLYGKAIAKAFATNIWDAKSIFPTEQDLFNAQAELDADDNWVRLEKIGKLAVTDVHGGVNREEGNQWSPEWADKVIPGLASSERSGSAFINTQRRLVFRSLVDKLARMHESDGGGKHTISSSELRAIGNMINVASGRGDIGSWLNGVEGVSILFFAPRWTASRVMWLVGEPLWHEARWRGGEGASPQVRKLLAVEWAKQAAAQAVFTGFVLGTMYALIGPPGDDEEWDFYWSPRSPYFGQLRYRNTYLDMTAGVSQFVSMMSRLTTGTQDNRWEGVGKADRGRIAGRYLQGKLAPVPSVPADFIWGPMDPTVKAGSMEWLKGKVSPLMAQDTEQAMGEGKVLGSALTILAFLGNNSRTQEERIKKRSDTLNEIGALQKQNNPERVQQVLNQHLEHAAQTEAKERLRTADPDEVAGIQKVIEGVKSPELMHAIEKEKYDISLNALEMLSSEDPRKAKSDKGDKGIETSRKLLKAIAPTFKEADELFKKAYAYRNGLLVEKVGNKWRIKKSVNVARRRLMNIYEAK